MVEHALTTIGYEGIDIARFLAELVAARVEAIADVRAVPISRKKGFSKNRLAESLASEGILYRHFLPLGDPKPGREAARAGDYELFARIYAAHLSTAGAQAALDELRHFAARQRTCLLCFERDPAFCHRNRVASALVESGFVVKHLIVDGSTRHGDHTPIRPRPHVGEGAPAA